MKSWIPAPVQPKRVVVHTREVAREFKRLKSFFTYIASSRSMQDTWEFVWKKKKKSSFIWDGFSLWSPGWPWTPGPPAPVSHILGWFTAVLAGFVCQLETSWSYHRERNLPWGNASMRFSCKGFSQLVIKVGGPSTLWVVPLLNW